jgi:hypothetical protein
MDETTPKNQAESEKRPYAKPQIQEVPLRPDEAVLGGCKTAGLSGATQHRCNAPSACAALTS